METIRAAFPLKKPVKPWWQDKARVGQKNGITRRRAKRETRLLAPKDQRTTSVCIYAAICSAERKIAALVLPGCNSAPLSMGAESCKTDSATDLAEIWGIRANGKETQQGRARA